MESSIRHDDLSPKTQKIYTWYQ